MFYTIIINGKKISNVRTQVTVLDVINNEIEKQNIRAFPVTRNMLANWVARPNLKSRRHAFVEVFKEPPPHLRNVTLLVSKDQQ